MRKPTCFVVTGAAGNLGRATAARLASEGVNLVCVDRTTEALDALVQSLLPEAKVLTFAGADLGDPSAGPCQTRDLSETGVDPGACLVEDLIG